MSLSGLSCRQKKLPKFKFSKYLPLRVFHLLSNTDRSRIGVKKAIQAVKFSLWSKIKFCLPANCPTFKRLWEPLRLWEWKSQIPFYQKNRKHLAETSLAWEVCFGLQPPGTGNERILHVALRNTKPSRNRDSRDQGSPSVCVWRKLLFTSMRNKMTLFPLIALKWRKKGCPTHFPGAVSDNYNPSFSTLQSHWSPSFGRAGVRGVPWGSKGGKGEEILPLQEKTSKQ